MSTLRIRDATSDDASSITTLIHTLAAGMGETSPLTPAYVAVYLGTPSNSVLLAETGGEVVGLLSFSLRQNLFHAAGSAMIEEFIIAETWRAQGVGRALMQTLLARLETTDCAEVSVTTMPDNTAAQRFYRSFGLVDEAVLLEKHFVSAEFSQNRSLSTR